MATLLEYVWIDGKGDLRSKTKVFYSSTPIVSVHQVPEWNFDGSSTYQSQTEKSDLVLKPVTLFNDPFRENSLLVLCEVYDDVSPHSTNTRSLCTKMFTDEKVMPLDMWFGIEQEYVIFDRNGLPHKWKGHNEPGCGEQGPYYCSVGGDRLFGRQIAEEHMAACIKAGVKICGINSEVMPSQWEFQVGPLGGIEVSDHLWMARYLLGRVAEKYNCHISYHPKPYIKDVNMWNGSGCHTNVSTLQMREENGIVHILEAIKKLEKTHSEHINHYGEHNEQRLSGKHETSDINKFSFGELNRSSSIRIPVNVQKDKKGYFEDRRPAANMDPYIVTYLICKSIS